MPAVRPAALIQNQLFAALVLGVVAFAIVMAVRLTGHIEHLEMVAYDKFVVWRHAGAAEPPVVLAGVNEVDIARWGWPLTDGVLADLLERIVAQKPRAIGVDIFRDAPRPPGQEDLSLLLARQKNIVWIFKFGVQDDERIPAPMVLEGTEQTGFADTIVDNDGVVRRGALFMDDGKNNFHSFGLRLALAYLAPEGIQPQFAEDSPEQMRLGKGVLRPLEANDGGDVRADAGGYQFLLDFKDERVARVTISQIMQKDIASNLFRDKVVILGTTAESVKDYFYTPLARDGARADPKMFGIEVHARLVSQLVRAALYGEKQLRTVDDRWEAGWILLWTLFGAALGFRVRSLYRFSLSGLIGLGALGVTCYALFDAGWWLPLVPPAFGAGLAALAVTSYISYQEKTMRGALMQIFSRHVSPQVANVIWQERQEFLEGGRLRPRKMTATVLFSDLQGYTSMSESNDPQAVMDWLNEYMEAMVAVVVAHQGTVDKFIGDSIMAVFGAPLPSTTDAEIARDAQNAVRCALGMEVKLLRLNAEWQKKGLPVAGMRIGIFTGPLVAGSLGSALRSEYTMIGDTVNTASRLESFDKTVTLREDAACRILVGGATLRLLGEHFETARVGAVKLKGKGEDIEIHQVMGYAGALRAEHGPARAEEAELGDEEVAR